MDEEYQYSKRHLLAHLRESGLSNEEILGRLASLPNNNPDKRHYVQQFLDSLPEENREEYSRILAKE